MSEAPATGDWPAPRGSRPTGRRPRLRDPGRAGPRRHGRRLQGPADRASNRLVALKMILRRRPRRPASELARFRTEAEAVARLQHPNIVQIYEVGEHDGRPFFALEFVEGGSLDQQLAGRPLPAARGGRAGRARWPGRCTHAHEQRHRPPRPEAGQRPADRRRHAEDHRLRPGQAARRATAGQTQTGGDPGHAELHGPGAGGRAGSATSARRRTCTRWGRSSTSC